MKEGSALAAIDIGSNSILLETARVEQGRLRPQLHRKETVRLGGALDTAGYLQEEAMQRGWQCLERYAQLIAHIPASHRRVAATQTLREATNRDVFLARAAEILECPIDVITGEEEARLIYQGVVSFLPETAEPRLVVDIGGRSTELCLGTGRSVQTANSYAIGSVAWAQRFFPHGELGAAAFARARSCALDTLSSATHLRTALAGLPGAHVYGSSGTAGAISKVLSTQGHEAGAISRDDLWHLQAMLQTAGHTSQLTLQGLRPELLPVIGGGISVMCAVFELLQLQHMRMAQGALRHGLLGSLIDQAFNRYN